MQIIDNPLHTAVKVELVRLLSQEEHTRDALDNRVLYLYGVTATRHISGILTELRSEYVLKTHRHKGYRTMSLAPKKVHTPKDPSMIEDITVQELRILLYVYTNQVTPSPSGVLLTPKGFSISDLRFFFHIQERKLRYILDKCVSHGLLEEYRDGVLFYTPNTQKYKQAFTLLKQFVEQIYPVLD